jgi:hypothetical protein
MPKSRDTLKCRMRVCSKALGLASPVFKTMLNGRFREGLALQSAGSVEIPLPVDDAEALTILLNIFHQRTRQVPRSVSLETLYNLTRLVDKYDCHEAVEMVSTHWVDNFQSGHSTYGHTMAVYWCFNRPVEFSYTTQAAILNATANLEASSHVPLPATYIGKPNGAQIRIPATNYH